MIDDGEGWFAVSVFTLDLPRWNMLVPMSRWRSPIRAAGRILRAIGREIAAGVRFYAEGESGPTPQDIARRVARGEIGRDPVDDTRRPHESRDRDSE
jgi:hypothetical protein